MADVTVVIPTCDRGPLLERAVRSVLSQSRRPARVIVVDNGEQPTTCRFDDAIVEVLRTEPRLGPSRSRNVGANLADTELVAFLDDDDFWLPEFLERSLAAFAAHDCVAAVVGRLERQRQDGSRVPYKQFPESVELQRGVYYKNPGFGGSYCTIKREVLRSIGGFDERLPTSEDRDLAARLLQHGYRIAVAPGAVAVVRDHGGARLRSSQVRGNRLFIVKHWSAMRWNERYRACKTYIKRWYRHRMLHRATR